MASQPQPPNVGQAPPVRAPTAGQTTAQADQAPPGDRPTETKPDEQTPAGAEPPRSEPGFRVRGRMRRRLRYLRTARELSYRDLGGLMFDLHRFGGRREELLAAKLARLGQLDDELRSIEKALKDRQSVATLRQAGVIACPRCAAIHSSEDSFCPNCGLGVSRDSEPPLSGAASGAEEQSIPPLSAPGAAKSAPARPPATPPEGAAETPSSPSGAPLSPRGPESPQSPPPRDASGAPGGGPVDPPASARGPGVDGQPATDADQPTRIIGRPERPEGSTAE
jgi:hypothetical protein